MENIRDIKKHLPQEDYVFISKITGYSQEYIRDCIWSRRNNGLIVYAASLLCSARKAAPDECQTSNKNIYDACPSML